MVWYGIALLVFRHNTIVGISVKEVLRNHLSSLISYYAVMAVLVHQLFKSDFLSISPFLLRSHANKAYI
jgi:hypothetical protein